MNSSFRHPTYLLHTFIDYYNNKIIITRLALSIILSVNDIIL